MAGNGSAERFVARLYGVAALAHLIGNPAVDFHPAVFGLQALQWMLAPAAAWLVVKPGRAPLVATAALVLVNAVVEAPGLGNHWWLLGLAAPVLMMGATGRSVGAVLRWILLLAYGFAAFAKLNRDFLEPEVSCAVFFADHALHSAHLPPAPRALTGLLPFVVVAVESAVVVLLARPRTRTAGLRLGVAFHGILALDPSPHFYDFSSVLYFFFVAFADPEVLADLERRWTARRRWVALGALAAMGLFLAYPQLPLPRLLRWGPVSLFVPFALWLLRHVRGGAVSLRPPRWSGVVLGLVCLNGVAPYLELKSGTAFTMYANLRVVRGRSNHLVVRRGWPLGDAHEALVRIEATEDPGLVHYVDSGWLVPERNVRHYLALVEGAEVTVRTEDGVLRRWGPADARRMPLWRERLLLTRAVDSGERARCQARWLPAH